jgi:DNA helicase II / ATP-dependent DNA helicase PcrA
MTNSSLKLTEQQMAAVEFTGGNSLISAGAGTGKTRTLTAKATQLIRKGCSPERLLAITFTNKANNELTERIVQYTGLPATRFPGVKTSHSWCVQILRLYSAHVGLPASFSIYTVGTQKALCKIVLRSLGINPKHVKDMIRCISLAKNSGDPKGYIKRMRDSDRVMKAFDAYEMLLIEQNAVDFDGILLHTRNILRDHPDIREDLRNFYQYILVDEFQDWNNLQNEIISYIVKNGNLTAVGDDWQSIYSFRGANPDNFINFYKQYPNAAIFRLEENFRCSDVISNAAYALISNNSRQIDKRCFSRRQGPLIDVVPFQGSGCEAQWVVQQCQSFNLQYGVPLERIGILARKKRCLRPIEQELINHKVTHTMVGSNSLFQKTEIRDISCYLSSAINIKDDRSFERIINIPPRGFGPNTMKKILNSKASNMSLREACRAAISNNELKGKVLENMITLDNQLRLMKSQLPAESMRVIVNKLDYGKYLRTKYPENEEFEKRSDNIKIVHKLAASHEKPEDFLTDMALLTEDREASDKGGVRLSTIHSAKGLEYEIVFIVAAEQGIIPDIRAITNQPSGQLNSLEEERRVMFVAMTRAEKKLIITHSCFRKKTQCRRSMFIDQLPQNLIQQYSK